MLQCFTSVEAKGREGRAGKGWDGGRERDGEGWEVRGGDGNEREGKGRDGKGWEGRGRDGKGWEGRGRDGKE